MNDRLPTPFEPERLQLDGGPGVKVTASIAARKHLVAWSLDQKVRSCHEASHALAAAVLGIPVKAVDISDWDSGHTEFGLTSDDVPQTRTDAQILDQIVVALAAAAGERALLGQATAGGSADLTAATQLAYQRFDAGLDPAAPFLSPNGIPFSLGSSDAANAFYQAALATLDRCRTRAESLIDEHRAEVLSLAEAVYRARRLSGTELEQVLAGLDIAPRPPGS